MGDKRPDGQLGTELQPANPDSAYHAWKLAQEGLDWSIIAERSGYANAQTARVMVRAYIQGTMLEMSQEDRQVVRAIELGRLDELTATYWPTAIRGDLKHAEFVLKAILTRTRLLGLDTLHEKTGSSTKTIIIPVGEGNYEEALKQIVEES